jgi:hypothetical protein
MLEKKRWRLDGKASAVGVLQAKPVNARPVQRPELNPNWETAVRKLRGWSRRRELPRDFSRPTSEAYRGRCLHG